MATAGFYRKTDGACDAVELTKQACARLAWDLAQRRAQAIERLDANDLTIGGEVGIKAAVHNNLLAIGAAIEQAILKEMTGDPVARLRQAWTPMRKTVLQRAEADAGWERLAIAVATLVGDNAAIAQLGGAGSASCEGMAGAAGLEPATAGLEIPCSHPAELRPREEVRGTRHQAPGKSHSTARLILCGGGAGFFLVVALISLLGGSAVHLFFSAALALLIWRSR